MFVGRAEAAPERSVPADPDARQLDLLYRHEVEFAVGHGVAVHCTQAADDPHRAVRVATAAAPVYEVARVEAPRAEEVPALAGVVLDMQALADTADAALPAALLPLADGYDAWLDAQARRADDPAEGIGPYADDARAAVAGARETARRLRAGIRLLGEDPLAAEAFRFANRAMWQQRVHTVAADRRRADPAVTLAAALAAADVPAQRSWRAFQLAFLCLNLPALVDPRHPDRGHDAGLVDLLFFPTGGGKTEAYLGLTAFTLAIRRLQGTVSGHDGSDGVAVLMRYTLRLLTAQQFQRAAALICACELIRRDRLAAGDARWGQTPFRIGMWVGASVTPNRSDLASKSLEALHGLGGRSGHGANPVQLKTCPWCGTPIDPQRHAKSDPDRWRTLVFCGDPFGHCPFTERGSPGEGIPVITVDDEIYRQLPALIIATADKFAQLPWQGPLHLLFGRVTTRCTRHGYRSPDLDKVGSREERDMHRRTGSLPEARTIAVAPLRPPDLIIQDELHLISGPLGSLFGLYETAIDHLATWPVGGQPVRPKVIASTATIRRADEQAYALFWRRLAVFPPPVLDAGDAFFAVQRPLAVAPGRRYLGICAPGSRLKSVEIRVFVAALAAAQRLFDAHGAAADPWMTLVGYFNALRELGGMRRLVEDDVASRVRRADRRGLAARKHLVVRELTSRIGSTDIPDILDQLGVRHDPARPKDSPWPIDVLLATNMISVGVDVPRLGLMVTVGQPKTTAEYIQATSRVGRDERGPGLVLTIYNWARPRDLSHFESFEHYHATFYRHVEALSVTPFAARALDRGLSALLVTLARHTRPDWNANQAAERVPRHDPRLDAIAEIIATRAAEIAGDSRTAEIVQAMVAARLDAWSAQQRRPAVGLVYKHGGATTTPLLHEPTAREWSLWTCPTSLRDVEANVNLVIDEHDGSVHDAPVFAAAAQPADLADTNEDLLDDDATANAEPVS